MWRVVLAVFVAGAACADPDGFSCPTPPVTRCPTATSRADLAVVSVLQIDEPVADAVVLTHRRDGSVIAQSTTDAEGCAQLASEDGALLTVSPPPLTGVAFPTLLTTTAPRADRRIVHLRSPPGSGCVAGRVHVRVKNPHVRGDRDHAISYVVSAGCNDLGCIMAGGNPAVLDIPAHVLGSDGQIDLWVRECVLSIDWFQNPVTTCRDGMVRTAPHGDVTVQLGASIGDPRPGDPEAEFDGQRFPYLIRQLRLPDHVRQSFVSLTGEIRLRWPIADWSPSPPDPGDYLPTVDGGATLTDERELQLPVPPFTADTIAVAVFAGETQWFVLLPPGLTPVTLPRGPGLPDMLQAQTVGATISDDDDRVDHEALIASGVVIDSTQPTERSARISYSIPAQ